MLLRCHLERRRTELKCHGLDERQRSRRRLFITANHPWPRREQVGARHDRSAAFSARHWVRANIVCEVNPSRSERLEWRKLDARNIGHDRIGVGGKRPLHHICNNVWWRSYDHQVWRGIAGRTRPASPIVGGERYGSRRHIFEGYIDAALSQCEPNARAEQASTDDVHLPAHATREAVRRSLCHTGPFRSLTILPYSKAQRERNP